ncbi:neutral zinc metallopeptidase [Streptomyces sp. NPDC048352]|uniref:neutral zinc metallopeptidase n=1 Tax=Streptomyces sp. NPDC048352 TaxID=3154718 RepID=UPI003444494F
MRHRIRLVGLCSGLLTALLLTGVAPVPPPTPTAPAEHAQDIPTGTPEGMAEYLDFSFGNVALYWAEHFKEIGLKAPSAFYTVPMAGESYRSACSAEPVTSNTQDIFYCPADRYTNKEGVVFTGGVFFPFGAAAKLRAENGDFAVAAVLAHEYGHEVQHAYMEQRGWRDIVLMNNDRPVLDQQGHAFPVKESELIADCFSGAWSRHAERQGYVDKADLNAAVDALVSAADSVVGGAQHPHGSKYERTTAYGLGFEQGDPERCVRQYWSSEIFD